MDMAAKFQDQTVFHMTGKRAGDGLGELDAGFRPALLAAYRDLPGCATTIRWCCSTRDCRSRVRASRCRAVIGELIDASRTAWHRRRTPAQAAAAARTRDARADRRRASTGRCPNCGHGPRERAAAGDDDIRESACGAPSSRCTSTANCWTATGALTSRFMTRAWQQRARREGSQIPHAGRPSGAQAVGHPARGLRSIRRPASSPPPCSRVSARCTTTCSTLRRCRGSSRAMCPRTSCRRRGAMRIELGAVGSARPAVLPRPEGRRRRSRAVRLRVRQLRRRDRGPSVASAPAGRGGQGDREWPNSKPAAAMSRPTTTLLRALRRDTR